MSQSSNRAHVNAPGDPRQSYIWDAGKSVAVHVSTVVIEQLENMAVENFRSITARGSEIGGVLFGKVTSGSPAVVMVNDFEQVPCDYSRGPLYRLSEADIAQLDAAIERRKAGGFVAVGFFRSHTRKGLGLDADDISLMESKFRDPGHISLLVRPYASKPSTAGIFIWEDGKIQGEASYLEFPFQAAQLNLVDAPAATEKGSMPLPPAPAAAKPVTRARVIPMASRSDLTIPAPPPVAPAPPASHPPAATHAPAVTHAATEHPASSAPLPSKPEAAAPAPVHEPPKKNTETAIESASAPPLRYGGIGTSPNFGDPDPGESAGFVARLRAKWIWAAAAVVLLACSGVLFVYPGLLKRSSSTRAMIPLTLRIERTAGDLLLTWNRESDAIRGAASAVLSISDGDRQENYQMDLSQLRTGSIVYSPLTPDVSFRMDVSGPDQAKIASEMVRVLRTRPSPMPQENAKAGQPAPVQTAAPPAADDEESAPEPEPAVAPKRAAPRPFNVASLGQRLRPATSSDVPLPAPLAAAPASNSFNLRAITSQQMNVPAPAAPQAAADSEIKQPVLVTRVNPIYPVLARQRGISGVVRVSATIGIDGKVKGIKVLSGNTMLQQAAVAAVSQWVYTPMLVSGRPSQADREIEVRFTLPK